MVKPMPLLSFPAPILLECLQWYFTLQLPLLQGLALEISFFLSSLGLRKLKL